MQERRREIKDKRQFNRLPFGDGNAYHDIWESREYKKIVNKNLLPDITDELVLPIEDGNGEETFATLRNGVQYHVSERSFLYEGKKRFLITVEFDGKVVREVRPVLPDEFYK